MRIRSVSHHVNVLGTLSFKMAFKFARSPAQLVNGGEMKISLASQVVMLHGFLVLPVTVYQPVLDHAPTDRCGDLMINHAALNAQAQESKIPKMVSTYAKYHAQLDNGGVTRLTSVFHHVIAHTRPLLKMVL